MTFLLLQVVSGECLGVYMTRVKTKSSLGTNYVARIYKAVASFLFGAAASQSLTDIAKYSIGRLRPHFLAVCKPVWDRINCRAGGYIENFTCTGDKDMVDEARYSKGSEGYISKPWIHPKRRHCYKIKMGKTLNWEMQAQKVFAML